MSTAVLDKTYSWNSVEDRWYAHWLKKGYFHIEPDADRETYTVVIPPPNVTGMLTMGHVLNNTIQDILIRQARMGGLNACWIPGTDHASIATETKVVQMLKEQGISKTELGREEFLKLTWNWKEKYGGIIINQLKRLGCSCDWERERFTMDAGYSRAVLEAFARLYRKGLVYRGQRLVNWCPVSRSAISDEEVLHREVAGQLWYFRYPLMDSKEVVVVATTRPETMLGDTAVAVNPQDERYRHLVGKTIRLPLVGREIPVIGDEFVDPEFGTGCVKVTPAHDPNDFQIGQAHDLEMINIMHPDASLNDNVPAAFRGMSREEARRKVVADLEEGGLVEKVEPYTHVVGYSERGGVPIELYLSEQWFLKMDQLSGPALKAVAKGTIQFYPRHWIKTYDHWMDNIKDWCISRQLWWGHRIPVYTCQDCQEVIVQVDPPRECPACQGDRLEQDPDVLDTWASSWLWPFAVHSWPEPSRELEAFYPTDTLVTGPDIIFFWVARMIMAGYEFCDQPPFRKVYFTSILRDDRGRKLSKSLGNSPDPFELFEKYGTDAVRFGIMLMAPQGLDVHFSPQRLEVGRNFMNKLWNASRFVHLNLVEGEIPSHELAGLDLDLPERWILSRLNRTIRRVDRQMERFHFNEAARVIYEFTWSDFCDWYIEIAKTRFQGEDQEQAAVARAVAVRILRTILGLLHPFAPFISEELWSRFKNTGEPDLIVSPWPRSADRWIDDGVEDTITLLQEIVTAVRTIRSRMNVPPARQATLVVRTANGSADLLEKYAPIIKPLARLEALRWGVGLEKPDHSATAVVRRMELFVPLEGLIDLELERERLGKRMKELEKHLSGIAAKLGNPNFLHRAPQEIVDRERQKKSDLTEELEMLKANLEMLK